MDYEMLNILVSNMANEVKNTIKYHDIDNALSQTLDTIIRIIEKRDPYTMGHSKRVKDYSIYIANQLNLSYDNIRQIYLSSLLHDIGKVAIDTRIIGKSIKLTYEEYTKIMAHPLHGEQILSRIKNFRNIIPGVKHHHERYDGKGYPDGLIGDDIDLTAKIISVADAFDAMTSDRPYRKGMSFSSAIAELKRNAATQFDPDVVDVFVKSYEKNCA